jgi:hypothetical protein
VAAGARAVALLAVGMTLWVLFGAVPGAADWQVSGGGYVVGLLVAGLVFGLLAPVRSPRHLAAAGLLVVPGAATLIVGGPGAHPDAWWWFLSLLFGWWGAAGAHRSTVELRRVLAPATRRWRSRRFPGRRRVAGRRSALADGAHNR